MESLALPVAVILLAETFILGGSLKIGVHRHRRKWLSIASGLATAYVFVHLLPELSRAQAGIGSKQTAKE